MSSHTYHLSPPEHALDNLHSFLEQAANSVSLEAFRFPKQTVLLLGNEQNGVPACLLEQVDACVEVSRQMDGLLEGGLPPSLTILAST